MGDFETEDIAEASDEADADAGECEQEVPLPSRRRAADPAEILSWIGSINAKHMIQVKDAMKQVLDHPQMSGIKTQVPLACNAGASFAPFALEDVRASLFTSGKLALSVVSVIPTLSQAKESCLWMQHNMVQHRPECLAQPHADSLRQSGADGKHTLCKTLSNALTCDGCSVKGLDR